MAIEVMLGKYNSIEEDSILAQKHPNVPHWAYDPKNILANQLLFGGAPHEVFTDKNGRVRYIYVGFRATSSLYMKSLYRLLLIGL